MSHLKKPAVPEYIGTPEKDRNEPPKWTTGEVAAATSLKPARIRAMALKLGIKESYQRGGKPTWWTFTGRDDDHPRGQQREAAAQGSPKGRDGVEKHDPRGAGKRLLTKAGLRTDRETPSGNYVSSYYIHPGGGA